MDKRVTIYDIAARLGISTATVNRALTGKPRVKEQTRELVLKTAAEMGFKPNTLARSLARRRLKLAVLGFTSFPEFHGQFLKGARDAGAELEDFNTQVDYFSYDDGATNTPESDAFLERTLRRIQEEGYDGLLALARSTPTFRKLGESGVYVATAVNDVEPDMRRFHICYNGFVAGKIAAELIYRWMPDRARPVAIASGWKDMRIHSATVSGFEAQTKQTPLEIGSIYYNYDNPDVAYESTRRLLEACPQLGAIYVNTSNSGGVIRAVRESGCELVLVTSDLNEELRGCIQDGIVAASIFQNQYEQGRRGLHCLFQALANDEPVQNVIMIAPEIILNSNLDTF